MPRLLPAIFGAFGAVAALQVPLGDTSGSQTPFKSSGKKLVSSDALQADIKADSLLKRAKELYKIAELGQEEYNHPTRVIGSEGETRF